MYDKIWGWSSNNDGMLASGLKVKYFVEYLVKLSGSSK